MNDGGEAMAYIKTRKRANNLWVKNHALSIIDLMHMA